MHVSIFNSTSITISPLEFAKPNSVIESSIEKGADVEFYYGLMDRGCISTLNSTSITISPCGIGKEMRES